jgi:hypothetical protein
MVWGTLRDADGSEHIVSYSANEQNDQIIILPSAGLLTIDLDRTSALAQPGGKADVRLRVTRDKSLAGSPVKLELVVPPHITGISAEPLTIPGGKSEGNLVVRFGARSGPFNMPVTIRGTAIANGDPHVAEAKLELVSSASAAAH